MQGNKGLVVAALVIVIVIAGWAVYRSTRDDVNIPQRLLDEKRDYILAEEPWTTQTMRYGDWVELKEDTETGCRYKDGKKWALAMTCATCKKRIPVQPQKVGEDADAAPGARSGIKPYKCPRCGGEANEMALEEAKRAGK